MNKVLVLITKGPYGTSLSAEAFRLAVGLASMEMEVSIAFTDDGVFNLVKGQTPDELDMKPMSQAFSGIKQGFGVNTYALDESLRARGLSADELVEVGVIDSCTLARMLADADAVARF